MYVILYDKNNYQHKNNNNNPTFFCLLSVGVEVIVAPDHA